MIKRLCALIVLGVMMSGCFMAPLALVGPAASGFSTASLVQSGIGATGNYLIKQGTGKTVSEKSDPNLGELSLIRKSIDKSNTIMFAGFLILVILLMVS